MAKFRKGQSGNPGGRPKSNHDVTALAREFAPDAVRELCRLSTKARSERTRIAAIRELLDRAYGRPPVAVHVQTPSDDPLRELLDEISASSRFHVLDAPAASSSSPQGALLRKMPAD